MAIAACGAFEQAGDPRAIPHLLRATLTHPSEQAHIFAKRALRAIGDPPAPALREAVLSPEAAVRARAIGLLGEMRDECDVALFINATRDPDREVRKSATDALGGKHAKSAVPILVELLEDDDREVVGEAAFSLGKIGDPSAVPALIECLDDGWWRIARSAIISCAFQNSFSHHLCYRLGLMAVSARVNQTLEITAVKTGTAKCAARQGNATAA